MIINALEPERITSQIDVELIRLLYDVDVTECTYRRNSQIVAVPSNLDDYK